MATYNNKHWLLSHIRNSFVSTDDTGISELVMNSDDLAKSLALMHSKQLTMSPSPISGSEGNYRSMDENFYIYPGLDAPEEEDELLSQSFDINFAQEGPFFRFRTNTDAKLDKMNDMRKKQAQIKTIKCDDTIVKLNEEMDDNDELFIRKDYKNTSILPKRSKFAEQLEKMPPIPLNKFRKFSCFDGTSHPPNETRTIQVFVIPLPKEHRDYPIRCCVQASAKIEEFIGFILFKCTQDLPEVSQKVNFGDVNDYGLFISDETGEPDLDFPALDINEQVQRFQFSHLALSKRMVQYFQNRTLSVASDSNLMNPVVRQPSVDTNRSIPSTIRRTEEIAMNVHDTMVEAPIYRAYRVFLITKKHFRTEVQLGISGDKVEIDPLHQRNANYFFKPVKAIHYSMDSVAWCGISSRKSNRFEFKIAHNPMFLDPLTFGPSTSFVETSTPSTFTLKIHTFETDPTIAEEVVAKIDNILMLRTSSVRREYLNRHEKTKKSFIRKKKFPI
ncbi:CLUMA_CG014505, isoform A [Clunio marinus]|uniref:CLUMA_CG014505, isoform A n=1 Tax=Clunio marinus TaxID=568069 RepID=A0A1J1IRA6_9DIPT|nr:CLUMA_CG014505, isoform A [Clunio marinus]